MRCGLWSLCPRGTVRHERPLSIEGEEHLYSERKDKQTRSLLTKLLIVIHQLYKRSVTSIMEGRCQCSTDTYQLAEETRWTDVCGLVIPGEKYRFRTFDVVPKCVSFLEEGTTTQRLFTWDTRAAFQQVKKPTRIWLLSTVGMDTISIYSRLNDFAVDAGFNEHCSALMDAWYPGEHATFFKTAKWVSTSVFWCIFDFQQLECNHFIFESKWQLIKSRRNSLKPSWEITFKRPRIWKPPWSWPLTTEI